MITQPSVHGLRFVTVLLASVLAGSGCEDATVDARPLVEHADIPSPSAPRPAPARTSPEGVTVGGRVATDLGTAVVGRPVVLVDAQGGRHEVLTDEGGVFHVIDVVPPYDLAVAGSPSTEWPTPTVILGLSRVDPHIELFEREEPGVRAPAQPVRVEVKLPECPASACVLSVVTASPSGHGASAATYTKRRKTMTLTVEHELEGEVVGDPGTLTVHVLTADEERTTFAYARTTDVLAHPGMPTDVGTLAPQPVAATEPLTVHATSRGGGEGRSWTLGTWLVLGDGASMSLTYGARSEETVRLPLVDGAHLRTAAWTQQAAVAERQDFESTAQAWSGDRPLKGGALALDVPIAPAPVRPTLDGKLSRRARAITWTSAASPGSANLAEVTLTDVARGAVRAHVWTTGEQVPLARLELLGIERLEPTKHVLAITTTPGHTVDDVASPDASARHARRDPGRAGAIGHLRYAFDVTP